VFQLRLGNPEDLDGYEEQLLLLHLEDGEAGSLARVSQGLTKHLSFGRVDERVRGEHALERGKGSPRARENGTAVDLAAEREQIAGERSQVALPEPPRLLDRAPHDTLRLRERQALRRVIRLDRAGRGVVRECEAPAIEKDGRRRLSAHRDRRRPTGMGA
jgi:hypothetical protein